MKWWFKWMLGYQSKGNSATSLGTAWHEVMAHHYEEIEKWQKGGRTPDIRFVSGAVEPVFQYFKATDHYETLDWMYDGYLEHYGIDPEWEVVEFESTQQVEISPGLWYEWTTDLLVFDHTLNKLRVVDHKSTKNKLRRSEVDLSDQLGLYIYAQNMRGQRVADGVVSQSRTHKLVRPMTLDERYQRLPSYRSPVELENIWEDMKATVRKMLEYRDNPRLVPYSDPDVRVCSWKCDYIEPHLILRKTPQNKWGQRLEPLLRAKGFEQRPVPRGSERIL